jgi:CRP/FNR family cyclic AMP-dependent transcriptional regulator
MVREAVMDKRDLLARHALFAGLQPGELERLATYLRHVEHPAAHVLFRKGDPGTNMMVVVRGRVKVCTHSDEGKELVLNLFGPGGVFGEIAILDGADRTADAVTMERSDLLVLERRDFVPFLHDHPGACMRMMAVLCKKLRETSLFLEEALFLEGPSRLAKRLAHLADSFGEPVADGVRIKFHLSQGELGSLVGMSRESMNKQLRQWREEGLVRMEHGHLILTDIDTLRDI